MAPITTMTSVESPESVATCSSWDRLSNEGCLSSDPDVLSSPPIVICGMAMRLPGGISSEEQLWDLLINKGNARSEVPLERYNAAAFHGRTTYGYFLDGDIRAFDASMFKMTKAELDVLDPQARLLLELTRECFENAGEVGWRGQNIGVYIGTWSDTDFKELQCKDPEYGDLAYSVTGIMDFQYSNKISHEYDLHGPSVTLKSACSSGLAAVHDAFRAIQAGDIRSALVGGTNLLLSPTQTSLMYKAGVLSPNDQCRSFDAGGDGYCRAEAVNMLYIKRLDDAIRDGNPIRAVIRGTFSNADGEGEGLFAPNALAHEALIRSCYQSAGITDLGKTAHFECHGTGTPVGDPIETSAVGKVFEEFGGITIGSVKPNLGHSEGASGITSLMKSILALENKIIPPNIKFESPNPNIPWDSGLRVLLDPTPLPKDRAERISINAFGLGGSNAHVILESASSLNLIAQSDQSQHTRDALTVVPRTELVVYSANRSESVQVGIKNLVDRIESQPQTLDHVAYTLALHREHQRWRTFAITNGIDGVNFHSPLKLSPAQRACDLAFVFTGQGAQWATMGSGLLADFPSAQDNVTLMDAALSELGPGLSPEWKIKDELAKPQGESQVGQAEFGQALSTAVQIMVVNILQAWGVVPAAVVGHSSGEIAAAYASGALTMKEAITCAYLRGWAAKTEDCVGGMAAVGLGREAVQAFLSDSQVGIACENSPDSVTLSGPNEELDRVIQVIKSSPDDIFVRRLQVDKPYHSERMKGPSARMERELASRVSSKAPLVPFYSTVSDDMISTAGSLDAAYWRMNMQSPVLFNSATQRLLQGSSSSRRTILLEIGPHSALAGPIGQILKSTDNNATYIPTLIRQTHERSALLATAGKLFMHGAAFRLEAVCPQGRVLPLVPRYPWCRDATYWYESRLSSEWRQRKFPRHELLGSRVHHCGDLEPVWRNVLRLADIPWCRDHVIARDVVLPATGYLVMICEAIRQLTGTDDYSLSNVNITSPLILTDSSSTETLLVLRPQRLTNTLASPSWYEVTISSFNGAGWTKHCTALARAGTEHPVQHTGDHQIRDLPRTVDMTAVYEAVKGCGLKYGPTFRRLGGTSSEPGRPHIVRRLSTDVPGVTQPAQPDHYHPVTIDLCFQLLQLAVMDSLARNAKNMVMPSFVRSMYLRRPTEDGTLAVELEGKVTHTGGVIADSVAVAGNGEVVMRLEGCKMTSLDDNGDWNAGIEDPHAAARLVWQPAIDFVQNVGSLISSNYGASRPPHPVLQQFTLLACIEAQKRLARLDSTSEANHLVKFRSWLDSQVNRVHTQGYPFVEDAVDLVLASDIERGRLLDDASSALAVTSAGVAVTAVRRLLDSIEAIYLGEVSPLDLLRQDGTWTNLYKNDDKWDYAPFLRILSHHKPHLRVLEIGGGTGGTTDLILRGLHDSANRMFHSYIFTDVSAGFFGAAKERFASVQGMEYMTLDISRDPEEQGFALGSFDLVVAANVLHATPCLSQALQNVRKLLRPDGRLLIEEISAGNKILNFIMGALPGWWLGADDDRLEEPYVTPERWSRELSKAGFSGTDAVVPDAEEPFQIDITILASPSIERAAIRDVSLLSQNPQGPVATAVSAALVQRGLSVNTVSVADRPQHSVISILDLEGSSFLDNISSETFTAMRSFLLAASENGGILWLTRPCQVECRDPSYAAIIGLARVLRNELSVKITTLELDEFESPEAMGAIHSVVERILQPGSSSSTSTSDVNTDSEYAWCRGALMTPRFHWVSVADELVNTNQPCNKTDSVKKLLEIGKPGSLRTLTWTDVARSAPGVGEVSVDVRAVGMNFKDILIAMGVVSGNVEGASAFGVECAGIITELGPGVSDLAVGDRVAATATGSYSTSVNAKAHGCVKIPKDLSFEEAATMPSVFGTVIYCLFELARLEAGESVLIHSACGGIGIAAIQICRAVGAEVYATVGSEDKVKYLMDTFDIPASHIFSSRSSEFLPAILKDTNMRGVDVVLNSLSGELLHASWKCVAEFGCMIELGKRDFIGQARLEMDAFEENRSFFGVHMIPVINQRPKVMRRVLNKMMQLLEQGVIAPIRPMQTFDGANIEEAFRFMQQGKHIGKLVVSMPSDAPERLVSSDNAHRRPLELRGDASYLLVGGLGGLGRAISTWLAERGATNLIFMSPRAGQRPSDMALVKELAAMGCTTQLVTGSVTDMEAVRRAIQEARLPVAGVLQMSMVLQDVLFENMTHEQWDTVVQPKVQGTWNLHHALLDQKLDFFVLFSSLAGLVGQIGQANYASANAVLDAFVQFRHHQGLAASVLDLGPVSQIGYVAGNEKVLNTLQTQSFHSLREQDVIDGLELAIGKSSPNLSKWAAAPCSGTLSYYTSDAQLAMGLRTTQQLSAVHNKVTWKRDPRMGMYRNLEHAGASASAADSSANSSDGGLKSFLAAVEADKHLLTLEDTVSELALHIRTALSNFMIRPAEDMDIAGAMSDLGVDSLVAIELRNWFRRATGLDISVLEITQAGSLVALAQFAAGKMQAKYEL